MSVLNKFVKILVVFTIVDAVFAENEYRNNHVKLSCILYAHSNHHT